MNRNDISLNTCFFVSRFIAFQTFLESIYIKQPILGNIGIYLYHFVGVILFLCLLNCCFMPDFNFKIMHSCEIH